MVFPGPESQNSSLYFLLLPYRGSHSHLHSAAEMKMHIRDRIIESPVPQLTSQKEYLSHLWYPHPSSIIYSTHTNHSISRTGNTFKPLPSYSAQLLQFADHTIHII